MEITTHYLILVAALFGGTTLSAQDYDLIIANGRVIDPETMLDEVLNLWVKDGKITAITKDVIHDRQAIDASAHVVVPGFIYTYNHKVPTPFVQKLTNLLWAGALRS